MYGQTPATLKLLSRAYRSVLRRMWLKNTTFTVALTAGVIAGGAGVAQAHEDEGAHFDLPYIYDMPGPDGTYSNIHPTDPNGVFAGFAQPDTRLGVQRGIIIYYRDPSDPTMYEQGSVYKSRYNMILQAVDKYRSYVAAMSGGQMDVQYDIVDLPIYGGGWSRGTATTDLLPALGYDLSDYKYTTSYYDPYLSTSVMDQPSGTGSLGNGIDLQWSNIAGDSNGAGYILHEFGHNLGLNHAPALETTTTTAAAPAYTYDFATNTYISVPIVGQDSTTIPLSPTLRPLPIGATRQREYGGVFDIMASNGGLNPRQKQALGWMKPSHFVDINATVAPGTTSTIRLYDDMADMTVVTTGTGADLRYGVAKGYQNVNYNAHLTRQGYTFHASYDGNNYTGKWTPYAQLFDFYYRSAGTLYPGQEKVFNYPDAVVVELNGMYLGYLSKGQTFLEKYVDANLFVPSRAGNSADSVLNLDDGSVLLTAPKDILAYNGGHPGAPMNPDRQRSVWYQVTYADNGIDTTGHWADLTVQAFSGAEVYGWQWDSASGTAGAQDGSGTWTAGSGGNWRSVSMAIDNQNWTQLEDATFGVDSGAAGTVTLGSAISVNSLTFNKPGSGHYTLTGNTLSIDVGGIMATTSATIASNVNLLSTQFWSIDANQTLNVTGTITPGTGRILFKNGQGALALGGVNTWTSDLRVVEGLVMQNANQTFSSGADLCLEENSVYQVNSGTLTLGSGSAISGTPIPTQSSINSNLAVGTLRLSSTTGTTANPEVAFTGGGAIATLVQLDAGTHFINVSGGDVTIGYASINGKVQGPGNISGPGGITKGGTSALILTGNNSFTGAITINAGSVVVDSPGAVGGAPNLVVNTGGTFQIGSPFIGKTVSIGNLSGTGGNITTTFDAGNGVRTLAVNQTVDGTYAGTLTGEGAGLRQLALAKSGAATLTLTGNNTYTGGTTVNAGTLKLDAPGALGTGTVTMNGGKLAFAPATQGLTFSSTSGSSLYTGVTSGGSIVTDFSPLHNTTGNALPGNTTYAYTGKIYLTAGQWSFGENFDDAAYVKINNTVVVNNAGWNAISSGSIAIAADGWYDIDLRAWNGGGGTGPVTASGWGPGKGIGIKTGASTSDGTQYTAFGMGAAGILLAPGAFTVANAVNFANDAEIDVANPAAEVALTGIVSGAGAMTKTGTGVLTLSSSGNTHSGATIVNGGTLKAGATNVFGVNSAVTVANTAGATLALNNFNQTVGSISGGGTTGGAITLGTATLTTGGDNTSTAFAGVISGTGGLTKTGTGNQTLSGQNTYTGATTVTGGVLTLDFSAAGAPTANIIAPGSALVVGGGEVAFKGATGATNTQTFSGTTLLAGDSTLRLIRNGATSLDVNLGAITRNAGGTINFAGITGTAVGARFTTTSGTDGALLDGGAQWAMVDGSDWAAISTVSSKNYIVKFGGYSNVPTNGGTVLSDITKNIRITEGGAGVITLQSATTTSVNSLLMSADTTAAVVATAGKTLIIGQNAVGAIAVGAGAKSLTLGAAANDGVITVDSTNAPKTLTLISNNASAEQGIVVNARIQDNASNGVVSVVASGGTGAGTVILAGDNTYTGTTSVTNGGTLQVGNGGATGKLGTGAVNLADNTSLVFNRSDDAPAVANAISGTGSLTQAGTGTTVLTGNNTYSGTTTVSSGTLQVGNGGASGTLGSGDVLNNAALVFNRSGSLVTANDISGTGTLTQSGPGTLILTGDNTYSGATTITAGTLQVGNGGASGSLGSDAGAIANNGTLAFNRSDSVTLANVVSGTGSLAQNGTGTTILTGANTYAGTTTINAGTLQVGDGGVTGSLGSNAGAIVNNGTLAFNRSDSVTLANVVTGTGALAQIGTGTLVLTVANTYSGGTDIGAGTLQVDDGGTLGSGSVRMNYGDLVFNRTDSAFTLNNAITGFGTLTHSGPGTLILTGDNDYYGSTVIESGTLQIGNGGTTGRIGGGTIDNDGALVFNRMGNVYLGAWISGSGTLSLFGAGTTVMAGNNDFTGALTIGAGRTLHVGDGYNYGSLGTGAVTNDGALVFRRMNAKNSSDVTINFTVANVISGSGTLTQNGRITKDETSVVTLSGNNTYTGRTFVTSGILRVGHANALGAGGVDSETYVQSGGILDLRGFAVNSTERIHIAGNGVILDGEANGNEGVGALINTGGSQTNALNNITLSADATVGGSGRFDIRTGTAPTLDLAGHTLTKVGSNQVGIVGATVTSGDIVINSGILSLETSTTATGSGTITVNSGGTLGLHSNVAGNITRAVTLKTGATIRNMGSSGTVDSAINLAGNATFDNGGQTQTYAGIVAGAGNLTSSGSGTNVLTGANTYTGTTTVSAGTLQVGNGGTTGSLGSGNVTNNATLAFNRSDAVTVDNDISGTGAVTKLGSGTTTLTGPNTYTGATNVNAGTLRAGSANAFGVNSVVSLTNVAGATLALNDFNYTAGSIAGGGTTGGNITLGSATLTVGTKNSNTSFAGVISGTGGLTKVGTGNQTLTGANTYSGATTVTGGTLTADFSVTGAPVNEILASNSTLVMNGGTMVFKGKSGVTNSHQQHFAGTTIGGGNSTLSLVQNGAASLDVYLGAITQTNGGTINFTGITGAAVGARFITSTGTANGFLDGGAQWALVNGTDWAVKDASNTYIVAYSGYVNVPTNNGVIANDITKNIRITEGGAGTNTLAATTTSINTLMMSAVTTAATVATAGKTLVIGQNDNGAVSVAAGAKSLTLGAAANDGVITVDGTSTPKTLTLISNNASAANGIVVNAQIQDNAAGGVVSVVASGGAGAGTVRLMGDNTYTGTTSVVNAGTLQVGNGGTTGKLGSGAVSVGAGATLVFNRSDAITVANAISGAGNLTQSGAGTTTLTGANTHSGATQINSGVIKAGATGTFSAGSAVTLANTAGVALDLNNFNQTIAALSGGGATGGNVTLGSATLTINGTGSASAFAGVISGTGGLTKAGAGTTTLSGNNTYSGATIVSAGTLQIGNGGATGSLGSYAGALAVDGTLAFNRSDSVTLNNVVSGSGSLAQIGAGTTVLTAANTYTGITQVNAGTLQVGNGGTTGSIASSSGVSLGGGTIAFNRTDAVTFGAAITGNGNLTQSGTGTLTLTAANTFTGNTAVTAGSLKLSNALALQNSTLTTGGTVFDSSVASHAFTIGGLNGAFNLTLADNAGSPNAVALTLGANNTNVTHSGVISGSGSLTKIGTGVQTISGVNTFTGNVAVNAGTLRIGNTSALGAITNTTTVASGATLDLGGKFLSSSVAVVASGTGAAGVGAISNSSASKGAVGKLTLAGDLTIANTSSQGDIIIGSTVDSSGSLNLAGYTLTKNGTGTLSLNGLTQTGAGNIIVNAGTLQLMDDYGSAQKSMTVAGTGTITVNSGASLMTQYWTGTLNMSMGIVLNGGTLGSAFPGPGGLSIASNINVTADSFFNFDGGGYGSVTLAGIISGTGNIALNGDGKTRTFSGANTWSGDIAVNDGLLLLKNSLALQNATLTKGAAAFDASVVSRAFTIGGISGQSYINLENNAASPATVTLTVGGNNRSTVHTGLISGDGSIVKTGTGSLTLTGNNVYTGGTTINAGTMIAGSNSAFGTGAVTVNSGGTLNGGLAGTANTIANIIGVNNGGVLKGAATFTGAITVNNGGSLAPGNSPGVATFSGGVTLASGAAYVWEISGTGGLAGTDFDQIQITGGTLAVGAGALLKISSLGLDYAGAYWDSNHAFTVAAASGGTITGAFTLDTSLAGTFAAQGAWSLSSSGGNVLAQWTAIPEPSTYGLLGAGAFAAAALARRRRKNAA